MPLKAFTDAAADALARAIAGVQRDAQQAEALRAAEHRAFMAEQREALTQMKRDVADRLAVVRDGADGRDGDVGPQGEPGAPGAQGVPGDRGEAGPQGEPGSDGQPGEQGAPGERGERGEAGEQGPQGEAGERGTDGAVGEHGLQGEPGHDGAAGLGIAETLLDEAGGLILTMTDGSARKLGRVTGKDGRDGADGNDGAPGERGEQGQPGDRGDAGTDGCDAYSGEARGLHDPEADYRALDVVSFNGSEWRAKRDYPGEIPGDGWMLSASRGKRGEKGDRGDAGREGAPAPGLIAGYVDTKSMQLTLTRDDGSELKIDLIDLAHVIRGA